MKPLKDLAWVFDPSWYNRCQINEDHLPTHPDEVLVEWYGARPIGRITFENAIWLSTEVHHWCDPNYPLAYLPSDDYPTMDWWIKLQQRWDLKFRRLVVDLINRDLAGTFLEPDTQSSTQARLDQLLNDFARLHPRWLPSTQTSFRIDQNYPYGPAYGSIRFYGYEDIDRYEG